MEQSVYIDLICRIGQRERCCRYLVLGDNGMECLKITPSSKEMIDNEWRNNAHIAQGDNCLGKDLQTLTNDPR